MHARRLRRRSAVRQRGAVAIMLGITLAVLIGFAGLALDLGRFFIIKSELQNAMDACALAASSQLRPGQNNPNALTRAIAYGRVFTTGGVSENPLEGNIAAIQNRVSFQQQVVNVQPENVTFSEDLDGPYVPLASADPNTAAFVQCSLPLTDIPVFFMRVLNPLLTTQTVSALAVATLAPSGSSCAIPVAVCKVPGTTAATNFGLTVGQWYSRPEGPGAHCDPAASGAFCWVDFTTNAGGASELADLLTGPGYCGTVIGTEVREQGAKSSLETAWNSRFGVYRTGNGNPQVDTAPPDVTGYGYNASSWVLGANAYGGSVSGLPNYQSAAATYERYQFNPPNPYNRITSAQHQSLGRNRRVVVAPVLDCANLNSGAVVEGTACVLMLEPMFDSPPVARLEFLGMSTTPGSPCATNGAPGTFGPLVPQLVQ